MRNAFSLLELVVCIAIVSILCTICITGYQGSLDTTEIKSAMPAMMDDLNVYRKVSREHNTIVTAEFIMGTSQVKVTEKVGANNVVVGEHNYKEMGIIKRKLAFREYRWQDGAKTPATFTFYPNGTIMGGVVKFGSGFATADLYIKTNCITWDF